MKSRFTAQLVGVCLIVSIATLAVGQQKETPGSRTQLLPRLSAGAHLGVFRSYEELPADTAAAAAERVREARDAGMRVSRVHVSWKELEPTPKSFDLESLVEALDAVPSSDAILLLIETVDSDDFSLPSDLIVPGKPYALSRGRRFDDPTIIQRFAALLDQVTPLLVARRIFAVSVGNEPDNYFDDVDIDSAAGKAWRDSLVGFLRAARTKIQSEVPDVAVGMTLTQISLEKGRVGIKPIVDAGDVAIFNYYGQRVDFQVQSASVVQAELDAVVALAGGRPIVFQELGCPAGRSPSRLAASEAAQAAFLAEFARQMARRPEIRVAFWFQLVDWSPALAASYDKSLTGAGFPDLGAKFAETLTTIGLLTYANGASRPAWTEFLKTVREVSR